MAYQAKLAPVFNQLGPFWEDESYGPSVAAYANVFDDLGVPVTSSEVLMPQIKLLAADMGFGDHAPRIETELAAKLAAEPYSLTGFLTCAWIDRDETPRTIEIPSP